jgi:pimeloyl-ACP methyl ester carboxylesterase
LLSILAVPLATYVGLCTLLFLVQRSQIYFPVPESSAPGATVMRLPVDGAELRIWAVERPGTQALLYFGGNAEDVAANVVPFATAFPGHSVYLMNYRGYGGSTGKPSEKSLVADATALYDAIVASQADISVMGRSLGSGIAVQLATQRDVARLVLVTPFDSLVNVARAHYWFLPVGLLMRDRYDSVRLAPRVKSKVLVVTAGSDEIIPRARSEALAAAFRRSQLRVVVIEGARHNELDVRAQFLDEVHRFLGR